MKVFIFFVLLMFSLFLSCSKEESENNENLGCYLNDCYNHGKCLESGVCECEEGYAMPYCLSCKEGYMLSEENKCIPPQNGMVYIKSKEFDMGCDIAFDSLCNESIEKKHTVYVSAFQMDKNEVTVSEYKKCVDKGICSKPVTNLENPLCNYGSFSRLEHPVNCITWQQAVEYCSFVGKTLPTEAQWESAAVGNENKVYPWGYKTPNCENAVIYDKSSGCNRGRTSIVGSRDGGKSDDGVFDLIGNVWEWCLDTYDKDFYKKSPRNNPVNLISGKYKVVRGGGFDLKNVGFLRNKYRGFALPNKGGPSIGFRCVK